MNIASWGGGPKATRGKPSKLEVITAISKARKVSSLDLHALTLRDLGKILDAANACSGTVEIPETSRNKKPYLDALAEVLPEGVDLSRLTVASLKELTGAFASVK